MKADSTMDDPLVPPPQRTFGLWIGDIHTDTYAHDA